MKLLRQISRLLIFIVLLATYAIGSSLIRFFSHGQFSEKYYIARWMQWHCRLAVAAFGVTVDTNFVEGGGNSFIVSNHMGYLDVLVMASIVPCSFVTSLEMYEAPFIGWITEIAGCLYVDRRNKKNLQNEIAMIRDGLIEGLNIAVFPEATSTNGESVLRFRRPLYNAPIQSQKPIVPLCINYESIDGAAISTANRDFVCWYGDMPFFSHLWAFWGTESTHVRFTFCPAIAAHGDVPAEELSGYLAEKTHGIVSGLFAPISHARRGDSQIPEGLPSRVF